MYTDAATSLALLAAGADVSVAMLVFAGVVVTSAAGYLLARRTNSGTIRTSESKLLWDEGTNMRLELRAQVEALTTENRDLRTALEECREGHRQRRG